MASSNDDAASSVSGMSMSSIKVPIDYTKAEKVICNLCGHSASEPSPLIGTMTLVHYGKNWPWIRFNPVKEGKVTIAKRPTGKYCGCCINTFYCLGLDATHGSISDFYTHVTKSEYAHQGRSFNASQKLWIKLHNDKADEEGGPRLKGTTELMNTWITLSAKKVVEEAFEAPDYEFVEKCAWNEDKDGPWDTSKVTTAKVFGKEREGIWVLKGQEGRWKYKRSDKSQLEEKTLEDDGEGPFAKERMAAKVQAANNARELCDKERKAISNDMSHLAGDGAEGLLAMLREAGVNLASGAAEEEPAGAGEGALLVESDAEADEEEGDIPAAGSKSRLAGLFCKVRPKGAARSAVKPVIKTIAKPHSTTTPTKASPGSKSTGVGGARTPPSAASKSPASGKKPCEVDLTLLDGRSKRIKDSLRDVCLTIEGELKSVKFDADLRHQGDKAKKAQLQDLLQHYHNFIYFFVCVVYKYVMCMWMA